MVREEVGKWSARQCNIYAAWKLCSPEDFVDFVDLLAWHTFCHVATTIAPITASLWPYTPTNIPLRSRSN